MCYTAASCYTVCIKVPKIWDHWSLLRYVGSMDDLCKPSPSCISVPNLAAASKTVWLYVTGHKFDLSRRPSQDLIIFKWASR